MKLIKKLLLFSFINFNKNNSSNLASKVLFNKDVLPLDKEEKIFNENYIYETVNNHLDAFNQYMFLKNFSILSVPDDLQQININNEILNLDHDKYFYFEMTNFYEHLVNQYNTIFFKNEIRDKKIKSLNKDEKNLNFKENVLNILKNSHLKIEIVYVSNTTVVFRVKKSLLKGKFKKQNFVYAVELAQNGEKNGVDNNCMLISLKDAFVGYYYELKKYNNKEILENYYISLLMLEKFLNEFNKHVNMLSKKDQEVIKTFIIHPEDQNNSFFFMQNIVPKLIKIININEPTLEKKELTNEDFNKVFDSIINKIEYFMRKKYKHEGGTNPFFIMLIGLMSNNVLLKENKLKYFIPQLVTIQINHQVFNLSRMSLWLVLYNPNHIQYAYFSLNENNIKAYKTFIEEWNKKFNENSVEKTFNITTYKLPKK